MARDRPKRHCNRPLCGWATVDIRSKRQRLLTAQPPGNRIQALDQMRLIGRLGQPPAPTPGMR
jgi:hypothetical protein